VAAGLFLVAAGRLVVTSRALVLGGGGVTGVAWMWGLLAGLAEAGVDLAAADLVVGTSAGSVVGAQIAAGADVAERYGVQQQGPGEEVAATLGLRAMARIGIAMAGSRNPVERRARVGKMALAVDTGPEEARRRVIESRLPVRDWPAGRVLKITAVDAHTGEFVVFDKDSGVALVDAVCASCAVPGVWPPVSIGDRRLIDGGVRSAANADLAASCDQVVILAPLTGPGTQVAGQAEQLRTHAKVAVVSPDRAARHAIGRNVLDPAHRAPAARAGHAQAATAAAGIRAVWA
jgi:NTE family protein